MRLRRRRRIAAPDVVSSTTIIDGDARFRLPADLPGRPADVMRIGAHSYNRPILQWHAGDTTRLTIGRYCSIHGTVNVFIGGEHRPDWITSYALRERFDLPGAFRSGLPHSAGDVIIGNDVYIGFGSTVLSGVHIGDGAVVGAGALVTSDIPPYAIAGGVPARVIRYRFEEAEREALLRVRWWDWPDERVIAEVDSLSSPDIEPFLVKHDPEYVPAATRPTGAGPA